MNDEADREEARPTPEDTGRRRWLGALAAGGAWLTVAGCGSSGKAKPGAPGPKAEAGAAAGPEPGGSAAAASNEFAPSRRMALLISNGNYPNRQDLPPAKKNLADMTSALQGHGFEVTGHLDLDEAGMRRAIRDFAQAVSGRKLELSRGDSLLAFYFCGHGLEVDGVNLLVPAKIDPGKQNVLDSSVKLTEVIEVLPKGYPGAVMFFIDACRISITDTDAGQLNQIKPPDGTVIMYGTRKGRPALAPNLETRNTFFTGAIVESLQKYDGTTSVYDLCRIVEDRCFQTVTREFVEKKIDIAKYPPQQPQTAANIRGTFRLPGGKAVLLDPPEAEARWEVIQKTVRPHDLVKLCQEYLRTYPSSRNVPVARVRLTGALDMLKAVSAAGFSTDGLSEESTGRADYREDFGKALRGDKDAAMRVAERYRSGESGVPANNRRYEQWLRVATELGNGIASWGLYLYYSETNEQGLAARFRKRAVELGYKPPKEVIIER